MLKSVVLQLQTLGKSEVKEKKGKNQAIARQLNNRKCLFLLLGLSFLSFSLCISLSAGAVWAAPFRLLRSTFFLVFAFKRLSSSFLSQSFPVESRISVSFLFSKRIPPNFCLLEERRGGQEKVPGCHPFMFKNTHPKKWQQLSHSLSNL